MTARRDPYISVVVAARNDNHGGNMLARMQGMLDSWITLAQRYALPAEIVIVEWNPPRERPLLRESLRWPAERGLCDVRFIQVPAELHARFRNAAAVPLHQMIAKNVGIRRARGEFVLATNLDIVFSDQLVCFLAGHTLERDRMYRIDRYDVARTVPAYKNVDELLDFCETHMLRVFAREGEFQLLAKGERKLHDQDIAAPASGIRFGAGWYATECSGEERYRWVEAEAEIFLEKPSAAAKLILLAEVGPSTLSSAWLDILDDSDHLLTAVALEGRSRLRLHIPESVSDARLRFRVRGDDVPLTRNPRIVNLRMLGLEWEVGHGPAGTADKWRIELLDMTPAFDWAGSFDACSPFAREIRSAAYLHTNACGDFTLLAREDWSSLRAYPEFPIWPMHIDALLCYEAHHAGIRELILREPLRIYHVEHSSGAGWTPEGEKERVARVAGKGVPEMTYAEFTQWVDFMRRNNGPVIFNSTNWGIGDVTLHEDNVWP